MSIRARARWLGAGALVVSLLALVTGTDAGASRLAAGRLAAEQPGIAPFRGLGTWVDVYDYGPRFQGSRTTPTAVTPESVDDMVRLGVRTLYLQAAQDDTRSDGTLVDRKLVARILQRAHRRRVRVVAWYLPHFADVDRDMRYVRALARFRSGRERFDGVALDIEWTDDVPDAPPRNRALIDLAARARREVTDVPLGAIVLEPVLIEEVNPFYWPDFPWKKLRSSFDVWLPMTYWTNRSDASGWKDAFRYTSENIRRVRKNLGDKDARVHVIGGIADTASAGDYEGFVRAAQREKVIGWSIYDYVTTSSSAWPRLRPRPIPFSERRS